MKYGAPPADLGRFHLRKPELMFVQDMPVKLAGNWQWAVPRNLQCFEPLLRAIYADRADYVYLTAKHVFVSAGEVPNRPGWHTDGFGTDDTNYVWYDRIPTEFCVQDFSLSIDHTLSMVQMQQQARPQNVRTFPALTLLRLDAGVVHRPAVCHEDGFRVFAKVSVSRHRYDLEGNAHNYLLNYAWPPRPRDLARNNPGNT